MSVGDPAETRAARVRPPARRRSVPGIGRPGALAAAQALAVLTTALLGFVLPVLMVVANKSAPATLGAAALSANAAALLAGHGRELGARYRGLATAPETLLAAGIVGLLALSLGWSVDRSLTVRGLVEGVPELVFTLGVAAAWPLTDVRPSGRWLVAGILVAGALILFEHLAGMPLHALARARGEAWDLKRSAIPPLLLIWPAVAHLWPKRRYATVAALALAVGTGIAARIPAPQRWRSDAARRCSPWRSPLGGWPSPSRRSPSRCWSSRHPGPGLSCRASCPRARR